MQFVAYRFESKIDVFLLCVSEMFVQFPACNRGAGAGDAANLARIYELLL